MQILGIDIGGTGIKGAVVDTDTGLLMTERHRLETPRPATPDAVAAALGQIAGHFGWREPIGCGFPAAIQNGTARTAANIDKAFIGRNIDDLFSAITGRSCFCVNDADAAALAEMQFGQGMGQTGVVLLVTVGTGLGTALFTGGKLLPNTELGHIYLAQGLEAEQFASDAARKRENLGWKSWGARFNAYLMQMEKLFWPDLIILGGGTSKKFDKFKDLLQVTAPVKPAAFLNQAGIVGAALYAGAKIGSP